MNAAVVLQEVIYENDDEPSGIRDLYALKPLFPAEPLQECIGEMEEGMQIRDIFAQFVDSAALNEIEFPPDLPLERLLRLIRWRFPPAVSRYHLRLSELYYRKGRKTEFDVVKNVHMDNKYLEKRYRKLQDKLKDAHTHAAQHLKTPPYAAGRPNNKVVTGYLDDIVGMRNEMREAKRKWVLVENRLGELLEPKTKTEVFLESMRLKLLGVLKNPSKYFDNKERFDKLQQRMMVLNQELERDNDLYDGIKHYAEHRRNARMELEALIEKNEDSLRDGFWKAEVKRLRDELSLIRNGLTASMYPAERGKVAVEFLLKRYSDIFNPKAATRDTVDQCLSRPIALIEEKGYIVVPDLYRFEDPKYVRETSQILNYSGQGYQVDLSRITDPHLLTAVVLRYLRNLPAKLLENTWLDIGNEELDPSARVKTARKLLRALPTTRRVQVEILFAHLHKVEKQWQKNLMTQKGLGLLFGDILIDQHLGELK